MDWKFGYLNVLLYASSLMYMKRLATCRRIATQKLSIYVHRERDHEGKSSFKNVDWEDENKILYRL